MQTFIWVNQQMWLPDKTEMSAETYSNKSMTYLKGRWDENWLFLYFWVRTVIRGQKCSEGPKICSHLYMNKACVVARYAWEGIIHLETDLKWTSEYLRCNQCSIASTSTPENKDKYFNESLRQHRVLLFCFFLSCSDRWNPEILSMDSAASLWAAFRWTAGEGNIL